MLALDANRPSAFCGDRDPPPAFFRSGRLTLIPIKVVLLQRSLVTVYVQSSPNEKQAQESPMKVKDAMHKKAEWVGPDTLVADVAKKMRDLDVGSIPVGENDRLIGMVTDRDITLRAVATGKDCSKLTARDVMTKGIVYCQESETIQDALKIMEQKKIRRLPVINDKKRMVGMLSIGDISQTAPREMSGGLMAAVSSHHA
jgi:CBS domain-containing protein